MIKAMTIIVMVDIRKSVFFVAFWVLVYRFMCTKCKIKNYF